MPRNPNAAPRAKTPEGQALSGDPEIPENQTPPDSLEDWDKTTAKNDVENDGNLPDSEATDLPESYAPPEYRNESAENALEVQRNETLRTDAEILGNRYPIRQSIKAVGNRYEQAKDWSKAKWENAKDTPGLVAKSVAFKFAESSYNRRKAKLDEVAHLPDNHPLKKYRLGKLKKAEDRLNRRRISLETHKCRMRSRNENVRKGFEKRRAATIAELAKRRKDALARRETRHALRRQGAGFLESYNAAKEHVNNIPKEQLNRIASLAVSESLARKAAQSESRKANRAAKNLENTEVSASAIAEQLSSAQKDLADIHGQFQKMERKANVEIPILREKIAEQQKIVDETPADSPQLFAARHELVELERELAAAEQEVADYEQRSDEAMERVKNLRESHEKAQADLAARQTNLDNLNRSAEAAHRRASETTTAARQQVNESFR